MSVVQACVWLTRVWRKSLPNSRAPSIDVPIEGIQGGGAVMRSQNALRRATRSFGGLPAMIAALIAPIEMPPIQFGCRSASASA